MVSTYKPVSFNEGAPLDPQKLMELQANVTSLVTDVNNLTNTTLEDQYTLKIDGGSFMTDDLQVGKPYTKEVPYSPIFTGVPSIVASIGSGIGDGSIVTISIADADTKPKIQVHTNKNRGPVRINWMAFQKK